MRGKAIPNLVNSVTQDHLKLCFTLFLLLPETWYLNFIARAVFLQQCPDQRILRLIVVFPFILIFGSHLLISSIQESFLVRLHMSLCYSLNTYCMHLPHDLCIGHFLLFSKRKTIYTIQISRGPLPYFFNSYRYCSSWASER